MKERIIVTLTTWSKRIQNIPEVLDTIYCQTQVPNLVVLNLAEDEIIPNSIKEYIDEHKIEVNRCQDTKVFKKLIPTLKKYPNDCVISIDDDWLYPKEMIEDFMQVHNKYPNNPISGNRVISEYLHCQCHCGCASLTKADYFGEYLDVIDEDVIKNCPSDDFVYTFFTAKAGHPYVRSHKEYYLNMKPYNSSVAYSEGNDYYIVKTYEYLTSRFGPVDNLFLGYVNDYNVADIINDIHKKSINQYQLIVESNTYKFASKLQKIARRFK